MLRLRVLLILLLAGAFGACGPKSGAGGGAASGGGRPPATADSETSDDHEDDVADEGDDDDVAQDEDPQTLSPPPSWSVERDAAGWPKLQKFLPEYALEIAPGDLQRLDDHLWAEDYFVPARFTAYDRTWDVQVRYRGASSRKLPKKSFQVRFPREDRFEGRKQTELVANWRDGGMLTEKLWYDTALAIGVPAPLMRYVRLELNGQYYGVFTELESLKKEFLENHGFDDDGDIYRCGMYDCELRLPPASALQEPWDKRTNEEEPWDALWAFLDRLHRTPQHQFEAMLDAHLEVDAYLSWYALHTFIANDFHGDSRSFLVRDADTGKWSYVPWDLNNAWSVYRRDVPIDEAPKSRFAIANFTAYDPRAYVIADARVSYGQVGMPILWSTLNQRILDTPALRERFVARLRALLDSHFTEAVLAPRIDAQRALTRAALAEDPFAALDYAERAPDYLQRFVRERREYLRGRLQLWEALTKSKLVIDRVGLTPEGRRYVDLRNQTAEPVDLTGKFITANHREPRQAALPAVVIPGETVLRLYEGALEGELALPVTVDPARPELGLFDADGTTVLDLAWIPELSPGHSYGRAPSGSETFEFATETATPP